MRSTSYSMPTEDTAEQVPLYEIASLNQRFFAFMGDSVLVGLIYGLAFIVFFAVAPIVQRGYDPFLQSLFFIDLAWVPFLVIDALYHIYFWTRPHGQTPAKRSVNNRVIKLDGSRLTLRDALIRYVFSWLNGLLVGIGWLRLIYHPDHRGWHDRAAGTIVVLNEPSATADTAPFRPRSVMWGWLPFGIPFVAIMAAINWRRLGQPERFQPTLLKGLAVSLVLLVVINHPLFFQLLPSQWQVLAVGGVVVGSSVLYAFFVSRAQVTDYEAWRQRNGGKYPTSHQTGRNTFRRILLASIGVNVVYSVGLVPMLVGLTAPLLPNREFTDGTISLTYPGSWWTTNTFDEEPFCQQSGVICLIIAGSDRAGFSPGVNFELERFGGFGVLFLSAEEADEQTWAAIREQDPAARTISHEVREIEGHTVVERHYNSEPNSAVSVYIKDRAGIYRFYAEGPSPVFNQHLATVEKMIDSIQFMAQL